MIEWLAAPLIIAGAAFIPKSKTSDKKKIEIVFKNRKVGINKGESFQYPKLLKQHHNETHSSYIYSLPYGVPSEAFEILMPAISEALNKEAEYEFKDGVLKMNVFNEKLPEKWSYDESLIRPGTWEVPIGKNHTGILYHDFDKYPHMLIGGVTRFGKTVLLKEMFNTLILNNPDDVEFYILDLKGGLEFYKYLGLPQVKQVACDVYEAAEILVGISEEIKQLEINFRENGFTNIVDTPIKKRKFIIVDEGAELAPDFVLGNKKKYAHFCQMALSEISRISGGLGMRLIYCTQYPTKQSVSMSVKSNIVTRISFIAAHQVASKVLLDEAGAEKLPAIPGRAIYMVEKKRTVQVPYIDDKMMFKMFEEKLKPLPRETR